MAKKRGRRSSGFVMSAVIRDVLEKNPGFTGRQCREAIEQAYPNEKINPNSFGVAFSNARKKLGISTGRRRKSVRRRTPSAASTRVNLETLRAARDLLAVAKDADTAVAAIKQLQSLQIG